MEREPEITTYKNKNSNLFYKKLNRNELNTLPPLDLQRTAIEYPANLDYRLELSKRLAESFQTKRLLVFDDVALAVPEAQRPHLMALPGYERILLPALMLSPGFEVGASVLVAAPPNPIEREITLVFKKQLEEKIGKVVNLRVLWEISDGSLVDIFSLNDETYMKLCEDYANYLDNPQNLKRYNPFYHLDVVNRYSQDLFDLPTLVIPFQTTEYHYERLSSSKNVRLPIIPNMNKLENNFLLREAGFEDIPFMIGVAAEGRLIEDREGLKQIGRSNSLPPTDENMSKFASAIVTAMEKLRESDLETYIKLDSNGVSGLGNLSPEKYPYVYDPNLKTERRTHALYEIIKSYGFKELPFLAVVEERIKPRVIDDIKLDVTVGGIMINGVFFPMSIFPFGVNASDEYVCGWMGQYSEEIGIETSLQGRLFESFAEMGRILAANGYTDGILAGDVMVGSNGNLYVHDYIFRRGGRSYLEALIALTDTSFFEAQIVIDLEGKTNNLSRYQFYTQICQKLYKEGIIPFSTSFGYFGGDHTEEKPDFLKFKLAVPLTHPSILYVSKYEMLKRVEDYVKSLS